MDPDPAPAHAPAPVPVSSTRPRARAKSPGRLAAPRAAVRGRAMVAAVGDDPDARARLRPLLRALTQALRDRSALRARHKELRRQAAALEAEQRLQYARGFPYNPWGVSLVDEHAQLALAAQAPVLTQPPPPPPGAPTGARAAGVALALRRRRRVDAAAAAFADARAHALLADLPEQERFAAQATAEDLRVATRDVVRLVELVRQSTQAVHRLQGRTAQAHQARFHAGEQLLLLG
jgi:hypothetical protein